MVRFRIPPQHRETVTIVRKSAYEAADETTVAEDVVCIVQPVTSATVTRDATQLQSGIAMQETDRMALLSTPNLDIKKGDFLVRSDPTEDFRIIDVLHVKGSPVMRLYLRQQGIL